MRKYRQSGHQRGKTPGICGIITIFTSIGDTQEDIAWTERLPNVITEAIEPKEGAQQADVQYNICIRLRYFVKVC